MKVFLLLLFLQTPVTHENIVTIQNIPAPGSCDTLGSIAVGVNTFYICTLDNAGGQSWSKNICCLVRKW